MARSKQIVPYIGRLSRSKVATCRGLHRGLKKSDAPSKVAPEPFKEVPVGGAKNGEKRLVPTQKAATSYPAEDIRQPKHSRKSPKPPSLRHSITPGTILILLAGRFKGKRVVFLKQLASGLLLVTGPHSLNRVPLRRVNQSYVISTSTKLDLSGLKLDEKINDAYFVKSSASRSRNAESEFFADGKPKEKAPYPKSKLLDQQGVDKTIIEVMEKTENLTKYLKARWGLSNGQFPHQLMF